MKLLNKKSFILFMVGFGLYWLAILLNFISGLAAVGSIEPTATAYNGVDISLAVSVLKGIVIAVVIIDFIAGLGLSLMYFFFVMRHRKKPKKTYVTVLLVFICITAFFLVINLLVNSASALLARTSGAGLTASIIELAACACGIVACAIQMSGKTPLAAPSTPVYTQPYVPSNVPPQFNPYTQSGSAYQQNPYGQPNPYGQNPYAVNSQQGANPYAANPQQSPDSYEQSAQNANPYAQQNTNPYAPGYNPYKPEDGQAPQGNEDKK